jgi:hypothetical protein
MLSLSVIEILKKLDKKELKRFGEFIGSPYFNSINKLQDLYDIISKEYPGFSGVKLDDKKVFKKLYPGKEYKDKTIKNLYSEFGKILRKFLTYEEFNRDEYSNDLNLVKALSRKNILELSNRIINDKEKETEYKSLGVNYYWHIYKLENQKYDNLYKEDKFDLQEIYDRLLYMTKHLMGYFICDFSNMGFNMEFAFKTQNIEAGNTKMLDVFRSIDKGKLIEFLDSSGIRNSEVIKSYYLFYYYMINDFTEKDFYKLKDILIRNSEKFTRHDIQCFWGNIINIVLVKLVPSDGKYFSDILDLSKHFCSLNIYPDKTLETFPLSMFRNIIFSGLLLEDYEWTENFLDEFSNYIDPEHKENEINYNKGLLYFYYKKYEESLSSLSKVNFTDIYGNIQIRFYYVMNYIELKYYDSAESMIQSIRQLYRNNKSITEYMSQPLKDSLRYFSEIIKCLQTGSKPDISVYKKVISTDMCYQKKYILNKMKGML